MAQRIKLQDGNIIYEACDTAGSVNFGIAGTFSVTEQITVGDNMLAGGIITTALGYDLILSPGANLVLSPTESVEITTTVTTNGTTGNAGQVFTSQGATLPPAWITASALSLPSYLFILSAASDSILNGTLNNTWNVTQSVPSPLPATPLVVWDIVTNRFVFGADGTYRVDVFITALPATPAPTWPIDITVYGTKITGSMIDAALPISYYTRQNSTVNAAASVAASDYQYETASWSDTFTVSALATNSIAVNTYFNNYASSTDTVSTAARIIITRIGDSYTLV